MKLLGMLRTLQKNPGSIDMDANMWFTGTIYLQMPMGEIVMKVSRRLEGFLCVNGQKGLVQPVESFQVDLTI